MEIKINREIRNYTESMFFGLSLRQFIFSILGLLISLTIYFTCKDILGTETVSWVCIVGAAPFATLGFLSYHGMTAEQFLWVWLKSNILNPREVIFIPENLYYEATMQPKKSKKETKQSYDKITSSNSQTR